MLGHEALVVHLDEELDAAKVRVVGDRGVGARDVLAVDVGAEGNVLAGGQTQNVGGMRKSEDEVEDVGGDQHLAHQLELAPVRGVDDLGRRLDDGTGGGVGGDLEDGHLALLLGRAAAGEVGELLLGLKLGKSPGGDGGGQGKLDDGGNTDTPPEQLGVAAVLGELGADEVGEVVDGLLRSGDGGHSPFGTSPPALGKTDGADTGDDGGHGDGLLDVLLDLGLGELLDINSGLHSDLFECWLEDLDLLSVFLFWSAMIQGQSKQREQKRTSSAKSPT